MRMNRHIIKILIWVSAAVLFLTGCNLMGLLYPEPTLTVVPTPTQAPPKELNICLGYEPRSLYVYKAVSRAEQEVLRAITDGPIDVNDNGEKTTVILAQLPGFDDGSAVLTPVAVNTGDTVVNSYGDLVALETGTTVFPSGCTSPSCILVWDGVSEIQIDQLSVTFKLKDDLKWSDGEPLTAADSVYAFQVAADPVTPIGKHAIDLTESYTALDGTTVEWKAIPGLVTDAFENYFWAPMPEHVWGELSAEQLLTAEEVNRLPLSYGPFMLDEWEPGNFIRLIRNPNYHRVDEGLPASDILTFKFLSANDPASLLTAASAECDLVSSTALDMRDIAYLGEKAASAAMQLHQLKPDSLEMLAIGISPSSYDDYYYPYGADRPDIFGDVRTRQAIAYCVDQPTIGNKLLGDSVEMANAILPASDPFIADLSSIDYAYNPTQGIALLEQVGWQDADFNPDTPFTAMNVINVPPGTEFRVELLTSESPLRTEIAAEIASSLSACGIQVNIIQKPLNELYQPGPDGLIFGRQFDLVLLSWQTGAEFDCSLFKSSEIPSDANYWLGEKTGGANFYGYADIAYDDICSVYEQSGLDHIAADGAAASAVKFLNEQLPFIPIYHHPVAYLQADDVCGSDNEGTSAGEFLLDIENISTGSHCVSP